MYLKNMYPKNLVFQNPNGTWGFVGRFDVRFNWVNKDGSELDEATAERVANASNPGMIAKVRVFPTKDAALEFAKKLSVEVTNKE